MAPLSTVRLPARRIRDQGPTVNACMSCALAAGLEAWRDDSPELSPLSHYFWSKPGEFFTDGLTLPEAVRGITKRGMATQILHAVPFTADGVSVPPGQEAEADGATRRLVQPGTGRTRLLRLPNSDREHTWKKYLRAGRPLLLVIGLNEAYRAMAQGAGDRWSGTGLGGEPHAVAILGFDDATDVAAFIVQDSRGEAFARKGQWFLPYSEIDSPLIHHVHAVGIAHKEPLQEGP